MTARSSLPGSIATSSTTCCAGVETPETGEHGIAHRSGHRFARRCQQFTDVQRITAGEPIQSARIAASCARKLLYRSVRQRRQCYATSDRRRQVAQNAAQWMVQTKLFVAQRDHQQRARAVNAPAEVLDEVERRFVGPMRVLDHQHRRTGTLAQEGEKRREQAAVCVACMNLCRQSRRQRRRDVGDWTERPWR